MYLVTFEYGGKAEAGVLSGDKQRVLPLGGTMLEFIDQGQAALDRAAQALAAGDVEGIAVAAVRLLAPIPRPRKNIFCIGKNYREHALEFEKTKDAAAAVPKFPVIFSKVPTAVIGPDAVIDSHADLTAELDYEVELAVVIGRQGARIPATQAMEHVFGYTIINDVTARDLQKKHAQWLMGKGLDTFAPMGPYLVHKSAVPDPEKLTISSKVNGELRQNASTGDLIFKIPELIATISAGITLEPGDIIATGTPAGVAMGFTPPRFLKAGDELELAIDGLGVLRNTVG